MEYKERLADELVVSKSELVVSISSESASTRESMDKAEDEARLYMGSPSISLRHCMSLMTLGVNGSSEGIRFGVGATLGDECENGFDQASGGVPRIIAVMIR